MKKYWKSGENRVAFEHARDLTAHHSKSFYLSTRLLPEEKQWATFGLYGFCRYADNLIDNPRDRSADELIREVDYLHEELSIAYRTGESEHPILRPFIAVAKRYGIPEKYPRDLLLGVRMDLEIDRYKTFDELYLFAYRVAGVVGLMMTSVLGYKDEAAFEYAEKLGIAMQLTNILRDVREDAERGRIYLPQDELKQFGVSGQAILRGEMSPEFRELMQFQVDRAHRYYREANPGINMLATNAQFAIHSASKIYRGILRKIEAQNYDPFQGRVFVPQIQKFGILIQEVVRTKVLVAQERLLPAGT
ncbi:MAG: phytoene/squalene synthase family protein [Candidatus Marinimicrobia bacterium]|nr:phytoene/squalene synthase family protein [Candidatus Neomarinimicrobiota bacterium]MCF7828589.1 phytoene/squalene synthase family protein [Candidatus Neomarinimicrobiota bacterium]MCF7880330.1 phytoene/squalene synthase family protein [Candidatus Neomarinimicrobiota bacterium]